VDRGHRPVVRHGRRGAEIGTVNEALAEVFGDHGEAGARCSASTPASGGSVNASDRSCWHAFDNDLIVDDPQAVIDDGLSFPPGESATATQRVEFESAVRSRFVAGRLRIHTRAGVFVCRSPRSETAG